MTEHNTTAVDETENQAKPVKPRAPRAKGTQDNESGAAEYIDLLTSADSKKDSDVAIIKLFRNEGFPPGGQPFGVNGRFFSLRAEVWYRVPRWLLATIDNCIVEQPVVDDNSRFIGTTTQPRFPYTERRS